MLSGLSTVKEFSNVTEEMNGRWELVLILGKRHATKSELLDLVVSTLVFVKRLDGSGFQR